MSFVPLETQEQSGFVPLAPEAASGFVPLEGGKPLRKDPGMSQEEAARHADANFGSALWASFVQGTRQSVGGAMEAAGDSLRPRTATENLVNVLKGVRQGPGGFIMGAVESAQQALRPEETAPQKEFRENLSGAGAELGDDAKRQMQIDTPEDMGFFPTAALTAANSAGQTLPLYLLARGKLVSPGFAGKTALGTFGAQSFGQSYNEARAGGADPDVALETALASGGAEIAGEKLGMDALLKGGAGWFKKFLLNEIGGEEFTTISQSLIEKQKYNPEKWSSPDEIVHDLALTAVASAMGSGVVGGTGKVIDKIQGIRDEQAFENQGSVKELMDVVLKEQAGLLHGEEPLMVPEELSPEENIQAEMLREQREKGIDVEVAPRNRILGDIVDELIGENQREGRTYAGEETPVQPDQGGVTDYVLEGRQKRHNPNELAPSQRPIRFAPKDESVIGLTLEQTGILPKGSVVVIGGTEEIFPTPVYSALASFAQKLIDKYAPDMRLIINLEQFAPEFQGSAFGLHQYRNGIHVITPRDLPGFAHLGGDQRTSVAMMTAFAHEFGHALKAQSFYKGLELAVGEQLSHEISRAVAKNALTDAHLASIEQLAPEEAGLLRTWRDTRQAVLDGRLTAKEFMDSWAGVRKLAGSVSRDAVYRKSLYTWAEERMAKFGKSLEGATAMELLIGKPKATTAEDKALVREWLSFDEYMAEQFSRAAHVAGDLDQSALGRVFTTALARLRQMFRELKSWRGESGEKIIQPGETFAKWLEKSTKRAGEGAWRKGKFRKSAKLRKALDERQARLEAILAEEETLAQEEAPPPEQVPPPPDVAGSGVEIKDRLEATVAEMEAQGTFYGNEPRLRAIRGAIKRGQFEYAKEKIEDTLGESLNWDRDGREPSHPEIMSAKVAGLSAEDFRKPGIIAEAADLWKRLKFESPYWKRWGGNTKVVNLAGEPLVVWRGAGSKVTFLDPSGLGGNTGVSSAKKAFWFTDNKLGAQWYADGYVRRNSLFRRSRTAKEEYKREFQAIREKYNETQKVYAEVSKNWNFAHIAILQARLDRLKAQMDRMLTAEETSEPMESVVQGFYLNMENPLIIDMEGVAYDNATWTGFLDKAQAEGYDGLILKNTYAPMYGTVYASFTPEQAKLDTNIGTFDPTDELHWDTDSQAQQTVRGISKLMENFWGKGKLRAMNTAAKMVDSIIQLQQAAAAQPDDLPLQVFHKMTQSALQMKNNLQVDAEETVKKMMGLNGASPETVNLLQKVLRNEWKGDALQGMLVGVDQEGNIVWGKDAGTGKEQRALVRRWEIIDSLQLRAWLKGQGVDVETEQGKQILDFYLRVRNVFLTQWHYLERTLQDKAKKMFDESPTLYKAELWKIEELIGKLRASPYMPQGHFGNYVLMIQAKAEGKRGKVTIRKEHFEKKEDFQIAYEQAQKMVRGEPTLSVKSVELKDEAYVPMQLPRDMLEALAGTGLFTDDQIELMSELMVVPKYDKILNRYEKMALKVDGANQDFIRTFADFTLRNSNFIWKMYYGSTLRAAIAAENTEIRRLDRNKEILPTEQVGRVERLRRNARLMEKTLAYMLHPPQEFQAARLWITLAYLAYNAKTAVMNFGTQLNTWAAVTTEYGEIAGNKYYAQGLRETAAYPWLEKRLAAAKGKEAQHLNEIKAVWDQAVRDGVIDQSYAYFLAGQANTAGALKTLKNSWTGRAGHVAMEVGMLPFRLVEKANRMSTLMTFYLAERGKGSNYMVAYETAVKKVNLLQNAYDAANKPELLRGKKSILFMFASFTQFQGWMLMGGYERAMRAQARAEGKAVPGAWHGTTMKLWLLYMLLGGLMGVPFAENVLDLVQWAWRRLFGRTENLEQELRELVKDLGGDPNLVMHGLLFDVGGFNLSGSFGMGRMLPGVDLLNREYRKPEEAIGRLAVGLSGPAGGFYADMLAAIGEFKEGEIRKGFMELPGATGAMSKALDAYLRQRVEQEAGAAVTTKSKMRLTWDASRGEFRDLTTGELAGMALGAQTTLVSQNREKYYAVQGEVIYWQTRRGDLMDKYWKALKAGDEELREDMREEIMKFNQKIPDRRLAITGKDLAASMKARRKAVRAMERYSVNGKKYRGIASEVGGAYEAGAE